MTAATAPRATYRIQLNGAFTFDDAVAVLPYLRELGVSHAYFSPYLVSRAGSTHGYDITDHNAFDPEIGGAAGFDRLAAALERNGLKHILDFVPNHMGVGFADNPWWRDILEWGRNSPYADCFDIDWEPAKPELRGKVMLPFLGRYYGDVLEAGELSLAFEAAAGHFRVRYFENAIPVAPRSYAHIFGEALRRLRQHGSAPSIAALERLAEGFAQLPAGGIPARRRPAVRERAAALKDALAALAGADDAVAGAIADAVTAINGTAGDAASFTALHRLLERQSYRLCYWRVAADEINYRRFFDINELAGLRVEQPGLFDAIHRLVLRLIDEGRLDGLRIDHVDGLLDPLGYCRRLRQRIGPDRYLAIEKILAAHETLTPDWAVDGTTGYDFMNEVTNLFVNSRSERLLDAIYRRFTVADERFNPLLRQSKRDAMDNLLAGELHVLANELDRIAQADWRWRDITLNTFRDALAAVVASFPVYRTYVGPRGASANDRQQIATAIADAARRSQIAPEVFDFIQSVLTTDILAGDRRGYVRRRVIRFAMRFQQYSSAVTAKGFEDTAFYRYTRFVALNEVGGDPRRFGAPPGDFHARNAARARDWPLGMLATMTHDAKRGEDLRARLCVLSEIAGDWGRAVRRWSRLNRHARQRLDDLPAPAPQDEYLLYQMLVGSWPLAFLENADPDPQALSAYRERLRAYAMKAVRESKLRSSWIRPDEAYEAAVGGFLDAILAPRAGGFMADFVAFQARIAGWGAVNGLAQTLLKLTAPGVPDIYQGSEMWDLRLVDPDNRRPVDFPQRMEALLDFTRRAGDGPDATAALAADLWSAWPDGRIKLFVIWRTLQFRRQHPDLFAAGSYEPVAVTGRHAAHLCAFRRRRGRSELLAAVPRLASALAAHPTGLTDPAAWQESRLVLPPDATRAYRDILTGASVVAQRDPDGRIALPAETLFRILPVALLQPDGL